jgi:hypothetical protein
VPSAKTAVGNEGATGMLPITKTTKSPRHRIAQTTRNQRRRLEAFEVTKITKINVRVGLTAAPANYNSTACS